MAFNEMNSFILMIIAICVMVGFIPFLLFIVFPFFHSFSPEKKFEKFINMKCIEGNEIAIRIKRDKISYYYNGDYKLVRAAIEGNEHAIRALKLETETQKNKIF